MTTPLPADPLLPTFRWNPALRHGAGGYIDERGRMVAQTTIRDGLDSLLDAKKGEMGNLSVALRDGKISLGEWQTAMMQQVKDVHLISGAMERGGWAQMTQADFGRVGQAVRGEYEYLRNFAKEIEDGLPLDGRFVRRAELYGEAGRDTYYEFARVSARRNGYDEESSIRHAKESCSECIEQEGRGYVPIGTLVPIGSRQCLSRCKCSMEYRNSETGVTVVY